MLGSCINGLARSCPETAIQEGGSHHSHPYWLSIDSSRCDQHGVVESCRVLRDMQFLSTVAGIGEVQRIAGSGRRCQWWGQPRIQQHTYALSSRQPHVLPAGRADQHLAFQPTPVAQKSTTVAGEP